MTTLVLGPARIGVTGSRPSSYGDNAERPIYLLPDDSTGVTVSFFGAGGSPNELGVQRPSDASDRTIWLEYVSLASVDVTVTADGPMVLDVFDGGRDTILATADTEVSFSASAGTVYMIRVRPDAPDTLTSDLDVVVVARVANVILFVDDVACTPGIILVTVTNGDPDTVVTLSIDGETGTEQDVTLDATGTLISQAVFIDVALAAGTYTLRAEHPGKADSTVDFEVLEEPDETPPAVPADAQDPVDVPQVGPRRFVLQDAAPSGLATFTMDQNPTSMSSPFPDNVFTIEGTTAPDGQLLTWEGARRAKDWSWSGYFETEAMLNTMLAYLSLNHRFYVIDHRNRAWVVSFESFEPEPVKNVDKPWAHNYKAVFLIYDGPLTPVVP